MHAPVPRQQALDKAIDMNLDVCKAMRDVPMAEEPLSQARFGRGQGRARGRLASGMCKSWFGFNRQCS